MEPAGSLDRAQTEPRADPGQSQDGAKTMDFGEPEGLHFGTLLETFLEPVLGPDA